MQQVSATQTDDKGIPAGIRSLYPPILLLLAISLLIFWSFDYGETARRLPLLVGTGIVVLIILDLLSRFRGKIGAMIRLALGAGFQDREMQHSPEWRAEIVQVLWLVSCVVGMALIGILATIPIFIFLYLVLQGKQKIVFSLMIAALIVVMVGVVFEIFLEYDLYRGMLLNPDAFE